MTIEEQLRFEKNNAYLQAKKIKKLENDLKEARKQIREKDNKLYEKDQLIERLRNAYNKMKGD